MRHDRAIGDSGGSSEPLSSGQNSDYRSEITSGYMSSIDSLPVAVALAAGLARVGSGEGTPADAVPKGEGVPPGGPGSLPFDVAAVMCGYEPTSPTDAAVARHDRRVWDLTEALLP